MMISYRYCGNKYIRYQINDTDLVGVSRFDVDEALGAGDAEEVFVPREA